MPQIRRAVIAEALLRIAVPGPWPEAAEAPASRLLISYLLKARIEIRHWRPVLAAAATMLTLRFAWNGGCAIGGQRAGAWAGLALSAWLAKNGWEPKLLACLALAALGARQFYPFTFTGPLAEFLWTPFLLRDAGWRPVIALRRPDRSFQGKDFPI